jgi:WD40 repeat protein
LLAASAGGRTVIYSLETGRELAALPHGAESVVFDSDDRSVLTAGRDGIARLWKYPVTGEEGVETAAFRDTAPLWCAAFAPEGRTIVTTSHDGAIKLWNRERLVDRSHLHKLPGKDWELAIEYSPDGKALLVNRDSLRLIDLETGSTQRTLTNPGELVIAMVFSADGKWLATGDRQGRVSLWDTAHWRRRPVLETPDEMIDQITFLSDRETPLVIATPKRMFVAGLAPGQSTAFPMEILAKARFLALSPDRRTAATLREQFADRPVLEIWDLPSGSRRPVVDGPYYCIAFSPDGRQFVAGGRDGVTRLWQTDTWGEPMLLVGHTGAVQSVVISADGRTVATAAEDATVKLWNAATGRELLTFEARLRYAAVLRFSRDGTALAVSGAAGIHFSGPQLIVWRAGRDAGTK